MDTLTHDIRYAFRTLRRSPGYTLVVVATLALGIAANATVFSILNPYLLRELPFGEPQRLVQIGQVDPTTGWDGGRFSLPQLEDWKARSRAFEDLAAYHYGPRNLTGDGAAEMVMAGYVTGNLFPLLRARPELGRTIAPGDDTPGAQNVVVLSHGLWTRRYGADRGIVGRSILIDGTAHTVIGVMPPDFNFPWNEVRLWVPLSADPAGEPRDRMNHILVGRLASGWSHERAREELTAIQRELGALYPDVEGRFAGVSVRPLREALNFLYDVVRTGFVLLLAAVGAVLLIACVNVAGLTLARGAARSREIAVRLALGAGRARLSRQLLVESTLLALAGGALGIAITYYVVGAVGPRLPESLYRVGTATVDGRVLLFSVALTLAMPLIFGLTPAWSATRADLAAAMKEGGRGAGTSRKTLRGRRTLVVAQVALAVVLLTAAGLMIRSFMAVRQVDLGFRADRLLTVEVAPPAHRYPDPAALDAYFDRATEALATLPGVRAAASTAWLPLNHEYDPLHYAPPEAADTERDAWPTALRMHISPGYFDAMGIALVAGRDFHAADAADAAPVVVVSRALAERNWPGEFPIGRTILLAEAAGEPPVTATVVGVVDDVRQEGIVDKGRPQLYRPVAQAPARRRFIVVATDVADPATLTGPVRAALAALDPDVPATLRPMREIVRENDFQWRIGSVALGAFGAAALFLAALGLYGVVAYSVTQRRRELGIRLALGATGMQIGRLVVGEGLRLTGIGLAVGTLAALAASRLLASQLFGVRAVDPVTLAAVPVLFAAVAALASARPAARAAATPPQETLRED